VQILDELRIEFYERNAVNVLCVEAANRPNRSKTQNDSSSTPLRANIFFSPLVKTYMRIILHYSSPAFDTNQRRKSESTV
jgi:hypothetical protein